MKAEQRQKTKEVPSLKPRFGFFSFFTGAGFLDLGFEDNGFETLGVNELSPSFVKAYEYSRSRLGRPSPRFGVKACSIEWFTKPEGRGWLAEKMKTVRREGYSIGFIGGPPCPDFSIGGKNRGEHGENGRLSETYIDVICAQRPDWFLFENVKGLYRTEKHRTFLERMKAKASLAGYHIHERLVNAIEFGVPQDRQRIFLYGQLRPDHDRVLEFPWSASILYSAEEVFAFQWPVTSPFGSQQRRPKKLVELTVKYWFEKNKVETHANSRHVFQPRAGLQKFCVIPEGDVSRKSYKRLHRWRYSPTACYGNNEVHLHPYLPRRLSVSEVLAIQSLPAYFVLPDTMTLSQMFKVVGNGVPYLMAKGVAMAIRLYLTQSQGDPQ